MDEFTHLHQNLEEVLLTKCGDDVTVIKRRRRDPSSEGVRDLVMASGRSRLNEDLESSTIAGNGYSLKDKNEAKTDKTEHGNGKSMKKGDLRKFSDIGAWVQVPRCMAWLDYNEHVDSLSTMDNEVGVTSPESTTQTLPSFEEYTPPVTYPEEVEKTLGTPIEVEPLNEIKLEEVGLNCNHDTPFSSREVPSFDGPEPQPLLNSPSLDVSLGDVIGPEPPIKSHSLDSSRMKVVDYLTTQTPPLPNVANSHPKGVYSYYNPGEELSLFDRPNEVERGGILKAHRLECILQQQISQCMDPSHHDGNFSSKTKNEFSQSVETASRFTRDAVTATLVTGLYLMRRSLEVLRKFHWMILGGRFNQLSHVSSPLLSKPGEY
ncbi:hypothetical protein Tco_1361379 [Tanacetum coccineum]